jgi:hypothetical protein
MAWRIGETLADGRVTAPAAARNREPILGVLRHALPASGVVLEVGSGSGEHVVHCARALPALTWQPSDPDPAMRRSIEGWTAAEQLTNVLPPLALDLLQPPWPVARADALLCINVLHISPWQAAAALFTLAQRTLPPGGRVLLYGPYRRDGVHTAPSNAAFDAQLRAQDPAWGVRDTADVSALARRAGFEGVETVDMPANNLMLVFRREPDIAGT